MALVEEEERADKQRHAAKRQRRRSDEEAVAKCLRDNFTGWDAARTDHFVADGMSLRQVLLRDRGLVASGHPAAPTLGKRYYDRLRQKYTPENTPSKRLKALDESQPLHPDLEKGLVGITQHIRRFDPILNFLERGPMVNQLSLVVLFKHALKTNPRAGKDNLQFLMAVLRYCTRHNIPTSHKHEWEQLRAHMDETLTRSWLSFKSSGLSAEIWWQGVRSTAKLVLDETAMDELIALKADGDWSTVEVTLAQVVQDTEVGKSIFSSACTKLLRGKTSQIIDEHVHKLLTANITQVVLDRHQEDWVKAMHVLGRDAMEACPPRMVDVRYRRALVSVKVSSAFEEYTVKVDAAIRGAAVDRALLTPMFCENSLVPKSAGQGFAHNIDAAVLANNKSARSAAEELLRGKVQSGTIIQQTLNEHRSLLFQLDRSFRLEVEFWGSVSGERAEKRLLDEVLAILPQANSIKSTGDVIRSLTEFSTSKLLEFAGVRLQATLRSVVNVVEAIHSGRAPAFDGSNMSPFMTAIMDAVGYFCRCAAPSDGESGSSADAILYGKAAAHRIYARLKAMAASETPITLAHMAPLVPFEWLVGGTVHDDLKRWTAAAAKADLLAGATAAVAAPSAKHGAPRFGCRKKTTADARALVLSCLKE